MQRVEFSRPAVLMMLSLALFAQTPAPAQAPAAPTPTPAPASPPPDPASRATLESDAVKAVAARKQRCRLHPGTCTRDAASHKPVPPKPAQTS
jgi:hypothetical protein